MLPLLRVGLPVTLGACLACLAPGVAQAAPAPAPADAGATARAAATSGLASALTVMPVPVTAPLGAPAGTLTVAGRPLAGATVPVGAVVTFTHPAAAKVSFVLDGSYVGGDTSPAFTWTAAGALGARTLRARAYDAGGQLLTRVDAGFVLGGGTPPPPPPPVAGASRVVDTVEEVRAALRDARPGDVIDVRDGEYAFRPRLVASAQGTATAPITLRGTRAAVLRSSGSDGDYGLHITGDHWRVEGLTVAHASKGIVLDQSVGTVLDRVEVHDIGGEGVHFRSCSSFGVLRNSYVHDTGVRTPSYGEGVYVGSARSNWSSFACAGGMDDTEGVSIVGSVFRRIPAEGADLKEGTDSGSLRGNLFDDVGYSGANYSDSAVDAKGNGWRIEGNTVRGGRGAFLDAFQTHSVATGYGTRNVFRGNVVTGSLPGYGVRLSPALANVVGCDNVVPAGSRLANVTCR